MDRWRGYRTDGLRRTRAAGRRRADADPQRWAMSAFAPLPAGLLVARTRRSIRPLEAALDAALAAMKSFRD